MVENSEIIQWSISDKCKGFGELQASEDGRRWYQSKQLFHGVTWDGQGRTEIPSKLTSMLPGIDKTICYLIRSRVVDISLIVIFFSRFVKNFICFFFQKHALKGHLMQGNLLKTTLKENKAVLKRKYIEISLYTPNIFHLGQEVIFTKHTFTF